MRLPEILDDAIRGARSYISRADPVTAHIFSKNAITTLDNGLAYVMPAEDIQHAAYDAKARINVFREFLADQRGASDFTSAQTAREAALQAVDRLETVLVSARPNDTAKALGLDWL